MRLRKNDENFNSIKHDEWISVKCQMKTMCSMESIERRSENHRMGVDLHPANEQRATAIIMIPRGYLHVISIHSQSKRVRMMRKAIHL